MRANFERTRVVRANFERTCVVRANFERTCVVRANFDSYVFIIFLRINTNKRINSVSIIMVVLDEYKWQLFFINNRR